MISQVRAPWHGQDGKRDGPVSSQLKVSRVAFRHLSNNPTGRRICLSSLANTVKIEHDAPDARSNVFGVETEFLGHLQHAHVFG